MPKKTNPDFEGQTFHSSLSPATIRRRLERLTKPYAFAHFYEEGQFLSKWYKDKNFILIKTGSGRYVKPLLPFVAMVTPEGEGSLIRGNFRPTPASLKWHVLFASLPFVLPVLLGMRPWDMPLIWVCTSLAWAAGIYGMARPLPLIFNKPLRQEVITFIEEQLLS